MKFFIPSEFGLASTDDRINADCKNWRPKYEVALKKEGKIDYALVFVGLFLDWGMERVLIDQTVGNDALNLPTLNTDLGPPSHSANRLGPSR